jgi:hypothetical protein
MSHQTFFWIVFFTAAFNTGLGFLIGFKFGKYKERNMTLLKQIERMPDTELKKTILKSLKRKHPQINTPKIFTGFGDSDINGFGV